MLVKDTVAAIVAAALEQANRDGVISVDAAPDIEIERPNNPEHGDFATNLPLRLARAARANPMQLAQLIAERIQPGPEIASVSPAPPGFINFKLSDAWLQQQVETVIAAGAGFGSAEAGAGRKVMVEFVSVNPTGPVHVGHTRGAVLGSALANTMQAAGYEVTREYYINDAGSQMEAFYRSVWTRYQQALGRDAQMPENGYQGDYIADIAAEIMETEGAGLLELAEPAAIRRIGDIAREKMVALIRDDSGRHWREFRQLVQRTVAVPERGYARQRLRPGNGTAAGGRPPPPSKAGRFWFNSMRHWAMTGTTWWCVRRANLPTSPLTSPITTTSSAGADSTE